MVEIRKLKPSVGIIKLPPPPTRAVLNPNYRQVADRRRTERRRADHPAPTPQPTPCVLWQGSVTPDGYGRRKAVRPGTDKAQTIGVHRWIVELTLGRRLRPDQVIMHLCDNRLCYRYDHLRVGTIKENNDDRDSKGRLRQVAQHMHGTTNGRAKLKPQWIANIRRDYTEGVKMTTLAREYGVSRATIYKIVNGLTWASANNPDIYTRLGIPDDLRPTLNVPEPVPGPDNFGPNYYGRRQHRVDLWMEAHRQSQGDEGMAPDPQ